MKCNHFQTGDRGQRYAVMFIDGDGKEQCFGWTDAADGGGLARSLAAHPTWKLSRIVDRRNGSN